jgi:hypothetical protein
MAINTEDLFKQKKAIDRFGLEPQESLERLKISRGYYANFSLAKSLVQDAQYSISLVQTNREGKYFGSHEKIFESLIATGNSDLIQLGYKLKQYHILRKKSDYDLHLDITAIDIKSAETYFSECEDRMNFFMKNPKIPYTKSKKVISVDMTNGTTKVSGLKVLN